MAIVDYLNYREPSGGVTGEIALFDSPTVFDGNTVPIRKNGRTLYAAYGDARASSASPINCKVNGETKRILASPVVDGSVSVGTLGSYSFTAPSGCKVVKIVGTTYDGYPDSATDYGYFGKVTIGGNEWNPTTAIAGVWTSGNGTYTVYVSVTSGKTYTLYGRWAENVTISYGMSINEQTAQFSWD
jgi:hypothetical protein